MMFPSVDLAINKLFVQARAVSSYRGGVNDLEMQRRSRLKRTIMAHT